MPVTTPPLVTVAMELSLLTQVPLFVGDSVVVKPAHMAALPVMLTVGKAFTVTELTAVFELTQPCALVPVKV